MNVTTRARPYPGNRMMNLYEVIINGVVVHTQMSALSQSDIDRCIANHGKAEPKFGDAPMHVRDIRAWNPDRPKPGRKPKGYVAPEPNEDQWEAA